MAASYGCRATAFDGAAQVLVFLRASIAMNPGMEKQIEVTNAVISTQSGNMSFNGWEITNTAVANNFATNADGYVPSIRLEDAVDGAFYLKVDVEGHEPEVYRAATRLIKGQKVVHSLFEFTYYTDDLGWNDGYVETFDMFLSAGYACFDVERLTTVGKEILEHGAMQEIYPCGEGLPYCQTNILCTLDAASLPTLATIAHKSHRTGV
ncbi:unnamed protein product [Pedinophyceae sp. YPF-701]|nr:unnamed protein product [Pedinophyceae sp. YPF-701]